MQFIRKNPYAEELRQQQPTDPQHTVHPHKHPPYMKVFLWLVILTAIEVSPIFSEILFGFSPIPHNLLVPMLLTIAVIKAALVALYYMHLLYDRFWLGAMILSPLAFAMYFGLVIAVPY